MVSAVAELRAFARATIPMLLQDAGGQLSKEEMHQRVEKLFKSEREWPVELDRIGASGVSAKRNAIAWAMRDLVGAGVLRKSRGRPTVSLAERACEATQALGQDRREANSQQQRIRARAQERAQACQARARKEGVAYDAAFMASAGDQVARQDYRCAATGIPFDLDNIGEGAGGSHYAPSPDRIVPAQGYVRGNVRWVLWMVNRAKGRMTEEQFLAMCDAVAKSLVSKRSADQEDGANDTT